MHKLFILLFAVILCCCQQKYKEPHVLITTNIGDIEAELYPDKAPKTVAAFLSYVEAGLYKDGSFYRVLKNEDLDEAYNSGLIQGGIFKTNPAKAMQLKGTEHESPKQTGLSHTSGTLSMARTTPGSATSEFFICIGDQRQFDSSAATNSDGLGYAAFGKVTKGMDVVRKIQAQKSSGDAFTDKIIIASIKRL